MRFLLTVAAVCAILAFPGATRRTALPIESGKRPSQAAEVGSLIATNQIGYNHKYQPFTLRHLAP